MSGRLLIGRNGQPDSWRDASEIVESVTWAGSKNSSARSMTVTLLDDDKRPRSGIDIEQGDQCIYYRDDQEIFRGQFETQSQNRRKKIVLKAYDGALALANNQDTFTYSNKTASFIFEDCCRRFEIPFSSVADTYYKIPELPKPKTTAYDVICEALSLTYKATGIRYYPMWSGAAMRLIKRTDNILQWVLETGQNITDYTYSKSIEKVKTRIKLLSKEGKVLAEASDSALEQKIGIRQKIGSPDSNLNKGQLLEFANSMLAESVIPSHSISITALGQLDVITGTGVFVNIPELDISRTYYVEQDTHTFKGDYHSMSLKLILANDTQRPVGNTTTDEIKRGDIVQFLGGLHHYSSTDYDPRGGNRKAGPAKVTNTALSASHPYHLIGGAYTDVDGNSNVYGWVDASQVTKIGG